MVVYMKRCIHCKMPYMYQASGNGCHDTRNDEKYCPVCMNEINKALEKVPIKREQVWEECNDYTQKDIMRIVAEQQKAYEDRAKQAKQNNIPFLELNIHRLVSSKIDWEDKENKNISGYITINKINYFYSWWTKKGDYKLCKEMEKDLEYNEFIGEWEVYRNE